MWSMRHASNQCATVTFNQHILLTKASLTHKTDNGLSAPRQVYPFSQGLWTRCLSMIIAVVLSRAHHCIILSELQTLGSTAIKDMRIAGMH